MNTLLSRLRMAAWLAVIVLITPPFAIACLLVFPPLPTPWRFKMVRLWNGAALWLARALCGVRWEVRGAEHLVGHGDRPVVVLAKHQSAWETIAFIWLLPRAVCYVFKRELLQIPFFGWTLWMLKMIHIDRAAGIRAFASVIKQGKQRLAEGCWILMFPEGTRTAPGTQGQYKSGGARLAIEAGARVLPIAHNAGVCWPRGGLMRPGLITVSIGPAIDSTGHDANSLNAAVEQWIETEMRTIDPQSYRH